MTLRVNLIAEKFIGQANGVYTSVIQTIEALKNFPGIELSVNASCRHADVIHAHTMGLQYLLKSLRYRKKLIISAHVVPDSFVGSLILSRFWKPLAKHYLRMVYNRARLVIAVSPVVKTELEKIGVTTEIAVLCNAVNRQKFKPDPQARAEFRKKHGISDKAFVILCAGQIQPRKGVADFIEVARLLPEITFVWVGGRPYGKLTADYEVMSQLIKNPPPNMFFTGAVDFAQMPHYNAMADVFFFPSLQETFGLVIVEAAASGLPVVLRNIPEYPHFFYGHYLKGRTPVEFKNLILKLQQEREFYSHWQKEADHLANRYEIGTHTQQLVALYQSVAAKAPQSNS